MYIKSIVLDGFKSYGQRTEVNGFDREFNAITGLNGSGKSNILDAICFVLGISNLSQVRAGQLQDLVYKNGQAGVTKASVTITFDNRDKENKPPGYDDYEEITVARQVVVGGKNKYMINGTNVQNKRVQDLFCSIQLNVNNPHFLIMQGRITKVLNMKPPEILSMIEEAAGTRMYETKKQGAEKLIERKDIKLKELQSIINDEITPKIQKLEKERDQFLQYQRVERELEHLNKLWTAWRRIALNQNVTKSKNNLTTLENNIQEKHLKIKNIENESKNIDIRIVEINKKKDAETGGKLGEYMDVLKQKEKIEAKAAAAVKAGKENVNSEQRKIKQLEKSLEDDRVAFSSKKKDLEKFEEKFTKLREADASDADALNLAQKRFNALSAGMVVGEDGEAATLQEQLMAAKQKETDAFTKIKQSQMELERCNDQLKKKQSELKESSGDYNENKSILSKNEKEASILEKQLTSLGYNATYAQTVNDRRQELRDRERKLRVHFERFDSQYPQLSFNYKDPESNFDRRRVYGPVCKLITLKDRSAATALETAAGSRLYNVVVDTDVTSKLLLQKGNLQQRTTIIPLNKIQSSEIDNRTFQIAQKLVGPENVKTALSLIEYSPNIHSAMCYVFGNVFVCRDLKTASKVAFDKQILRRCVTLDGDIVDPAGTLSGGAPGQAGRILTALDDMRECINEKNECEQELIKLDNEAKSMASVAGRYESLRQELDLKKHKIEMARQLLQQTVHYQKQAEVEELTSKIGELKKEIEKCKQIEDESKKLSNKIERDINSTKGGREKQLKDAQAELDKLQKQAEKSRACWIKHEQEFETLKLEVSELEKAIETGENQLKSTSITLNELKEHITTLEKELKDAQEEVNSATTLVNGAKKEIASYTVEIQQSLEQKSKFQEESAELTLDIQKLEHQRTQLKAEVKDFCQKEQDLINQNEWVQYDTEYNLKASKLTDQEGKSLGKQTAQLQETKKNLGRHVNTRAMSLLGDEEKQYKEMIKRKNMVENDKKSIFEIIAKLDKKKEKALMVAWTQVNKDFGSIFGMLLSGANAKLQPPAGKRVLDGLEVKVSFGGIWKDNLTELSGGQRSLVALSLILSMLLFKPAPLYILDEVDAALDLSHTQNIGNMLKTHFRHSQFIVVSLKDGMFNNANVLFRTKFVDGVSTIQRTVCKK